MARDGNGNYSLPEAPFVFDTVIDEAAVNNNFADIGRALTQSLSRDGQTVSTGNLPMGGRRHTNVADASSRNEYSAVGQVQDGAFTWCGAAGGTANALTLLPSPPITAQVAGQRFLFVGAAANSDAATAAISGLPVRDIQIGGAALTGGEIQAGEIYEILDDGTQLQLSRFSPAAIGHALLQADTQAAAQTAIGVTDLTEADGLVPVGTVIGFAGQNFPSNWLFANGQNVLRAQWPQLFARFGTAWGAGDGSTTFGIIDLRGRVVAGRDMMDGSPSANRLTTVIPGANSLGATGGNQQHTLTIAQMPGHTHNVDVFPFNTSPPSPSNNPVTGQGTVASGSLRATSLTGGGGAHPNVQPTIVLNKLVFAGEEVPQP